MSIARPDTPTKGTSTGFTLTISHTISGSDRILWVGVWEPSSPAIAVTGVTYNASALTKAVEFSPGGSTISLWYKLGPATGAHNVVVTNSAFEEVVAVCASHTGVQQSGVPDSSQTQLDVFVSSQTISTTVVAANAWAVYLVAAGATLSAGTGATLLVQQAPSGAGSLALFDSNADLAAGSQSMQSTISGSGNLMGIIASFAPLGGGGGGGSETYCGSQLNRDLNQGLNQGLN